MNKNAKNKIFLTDNKEKEKSIPSKNKVICNHKVENKKQNKKETNKEINNEINKEKNKDNNKENKKLNKKENNKGNNNEEKNPDIQIEQKEEIPINNIKKKIEIKKM
jgi:hypothetical protein